ncbi:MAG: hypothetical protein RBG13Loki_3056 [Promethearchaeota archaeon CR_4]|nr:MAG: hypothetical protein RBG13Loki_3056 [Candidatus Lokiarchaeota archaeon CR_4]
MYFQLCRNRGKTHAETSINHFSKEIPHTLVHLDLGVEFRAGALKCEHREILSYADCMAIAVTLQLNATFHTTENDLPPLARLRVKKYSFE